LQASKNHAPTTGECSFIWNADNISNLVTTNVCEGTIKEGIWINLNTKIGKQIYRVGKNGKVYESFWKYNTVINKMMVTAKYLHWKINWQTYSHISPHVQLPMRKYLEHINIAVKQ
jgi:hypothetical protein